MAQRNAKTTCSGMNWNVMLGLLQRLKDNGQWRDYLFIATGCYLGLRASDLLVLKWEDVLGKDELEVTEKKTGKKRLLTINNTLKKILDETFRVIRDGSIPISAKDYLFANHSGEPVSIQYINRRLHQIFAMYNVRVKNGSTHTLRKTFGKRIWEMDNKSERSLIYLSEIFSHSNIGTTKRYIGIVKEDIENIYLSL